MPSELTSIELCAGAGGQAIGLHQAGFRHVALVEIDENAAATLRTNGERTGWWPSEAVSCTSISDWTVRDIHKNVSLVAGGVPCPPFSIAGERKGRSDERDLFPSFLDIVEEVQPTTIMIENVRGLLSRKFDSYRDEILNRLDSLGFQAEWELLEAHEFGVPQLRPRSILVGAKPEVWKFFKWPTAFGDPPTVGDALVGDMGSRGWPGAREWAEKADTIAPTLVGGSKKHGGADVGPTRAKRQWLERLGVKGTSFADEPPGPDFDGVPRLTLDMAAKIQAFPPTWIFEGLKTSRYRQIGNAFPPPVARAVGQQIAAAIGAASVEETENS